MPRLTEEKLVEMWASEKSFSLSQAAALWIGESPMSCHFDYPDDPEANPKNLPERHFENPHDFLNRLEILQYAIGNGEDGELKAFKFDSSG